MGCTVLYSIGTIPSYNMMNISTYQTNITPSHIYTLCIKHPSNSPLPLFPPPLILLSLVATWFRPSVAARRWSRHSVTSHISRESLKAHIDMGFELPPVLHPAALTEPPFRRLLPLSLRSRGPG